MKIMKKDVIIRFLTILIPKIMKVAAAPLKRIWHSKKRIKSENKYQPVFIIGAPRTGSTILYQAITNRFDVLYIDNLTCLFHQFLPLGMKLSKFFYSDSAHNVSSSHFGKTTNFGLHAPAECGNFWYRWLPKDKHFIDYDDFDDRVVKEIHQEIYSVIKKERKNFVFKNLNAGQRLRLIRKVSPNAKIIFIRRNPLETALSIYKSRIKNDVKDDEWWSIMPPNVKELNKLPLFEKIVKQIYYLEKQIMRDKKLFPQKKFLTIDYKTFLDNPENILEIIKKFMGEDIKNRKNADKLKIKKKHHEYNENVVKNFEKEIEKLDW